MYDIIILGAGPAGLTAALYAARGGKKTLVLGGVALGCQMGGIANLENYPGWAGTGRGLSEFMLDQVVSSGAEIIFTSARSVSGDADSEFVIKCDDANVYKGRSVIIATGASPRKLEIDGARALFGRGISYCATCDGFFYSDKDVLVIGGGNSALNDALYLSDLAKNVKIVYRKESFSRAEQILIDRVSEKTNIECLFNTELKSVSPLSDAAGAQILATTTDGAEIIVDGIFVAIGHEANTDYLCETIKRDNMGRIDQSQLPIGIFVAGDVQSGIKMQIATAVGSGCSASMDAILFLNKRVN